MILPFLFLLLFLHVLLLLFKLLFLILLLFAHLSPPHLNVFPPIILLFLHLSCSSSTTTLTNLSFLLFFCFLLPFFLLLFFSPASYLHLPAVPHPLPISPSTTPHLLHMLLCLLPPSLPAPSLLPARPLATPLPPTTPTAPPSSSSPFTLAPAAPPVQFLLLVAGQEETGASAAGGAVRRIFTVYTVCLWLLTETTVDSRALQSSARVLRQTLTLKNPFARTPSLPTTAAGGSPISLDWEETLGMKCTEAELRAPHYDIRSHSYYTHNGILCLLTDYQRVRVSVCVRWMVMRWGRPVPAQNANVTLVGSGDKPRDPFAKAQCCCFFLFCIICKIRNCFVTMNLCHQ